MEAEELAKAGKAAAPSGTGDDSADKPPVKQPPQPGLAWDTPAQLDQH